jgi:F-type H+-transporting ATPase subunit c
MQYIGAGVGLGLAVFGAAFGIGKIGAAALEATGRQPEVAGVARITMIIAAALVEGAAMFGLVIALLMIVLKN